VFHEKGEGWVCVSRKTERKWVCDVFAVNDEMNLGMRLVCEIKNGGLWWLWWNGCKKMKEKKGSFEKVKEKGKRKGKRTCFK